MSVQWTLIAGFLYAEVAIVLLLVLPVASPRRWNAIFNSKFLQAIKRQTGLYSTILFGTLVLFLLDALREMRKYSNISEEHEHAHLDKQMQENMRLFRAQRNFYISGFALFLALVIRRLVILISNQAKLLAQAEASLKQAESATQAARSLLTKSNEDKENQENDTSEIHEKVVAQLKSEVLELEANLQKEIKEKSTVEAKLDQLAKEYDRLSLENIKLQKKITISSGDKKDE